MAINVPNSSAVRQVTLSCSAMVRGEMVRNKKNMLRIVRYGEKSAAKKHERQIVLRQTVHGEISAAVNNSPANSPLR